MMQALLTHLDTSPPLDQVFSYANLLQELLLALVGFSGDVFITTGNIGTQHTIPDPDQCNLHLSPDLDWVDAPDRALINELVRLGFHYQAVRTFIEQERTVTVSSLVRPMLKQQGATSLTGVPGLISTAQPAGSIYRQALATGLTEALDVYQAAVLAIQVQVMDQARAPVLASLHHQLHDYKVLLPQLHHLVYRISGLGPPSSPSTTLDATQATLDTLDTTDTSGSGGPGGGPLAGTAVLALLGHLCRSGLPALQSTATRLLWHCNQALHKQLSSWMVYGHLLDPYDEFFIRRTEPTPSPLYSEQPALQQQQQQQQQLHQQQQQGFDFLQTFEVVDARLPPCITLDTAKEVAFVGKAVLLLKSPAGEFRGRQLLPHEDTLHAAQVLRELQGSPSFDRVAFECCVTALRTKVAALLWHLVVQQAGLMSHLTAIKDYFLLAKGEFAHAFLVDARRLLALPPRPVTASLDVSVPWQQAALKSSAQHDPLFANFRIHWEDSTTATNSKELPLPKEQQAIYGTVEKIEIPVYDPNWDGLGLNTTVEWPLGLLLTQDHMIRYNYMFQMLLRLRRAQLALEGAWVNLCEMSKQEQDRRRANRTAGGARGLDPLLSELQHLRHYMAHVLGNLQIYIQVDVIESNFSQLEERIAAAQDFTEVEQAHANYLHTMLMQSFVTTKGMSFQVSGVFRHVSDLCQLVDRVQQERLLEPPSEHAAQSRAQVRDQVAEGVKALSASFSRIMMKLLASLRSTTLLDTSQAPHLRQLYLRLNYNDFLSNKFIAQGLGKK